ncbi:NIF family HAD-type phosphatase [Chamaesiphon sp. GL140_3_metabinner_50]|uniref:NIF family HAD-type phosphatase n=1 Tax=Chamaesiphon sp. GL140_3_metabinner_50 TaxID=2970812 RepID=UPI0025ED3466|nr:NIF family HAD-type phosphatase [Chamaesiphon sp. GL140_3_metabinner_50]
MSKQKQVTIALDLEGTLISNAVSQFPRPGLFTFLEYCYQNFDRSVIFTAVNEVRFRAIARTLAEAGDVPDWFVDLEYINWSGTYKDLSFIPQAIINRTILIDDRIEYIHPDQKDRWLGISSYEYPYPNDDRELDATIERLRQRTDS